MAINLNQGATLGNLKQTVENMKVYIDSDQTVSIKGYLNINNTHNFYNTSTPTEDTIPVFSFDVAADYFLDQTKTIFVQEFTWSDTTYGGSTDPNLEGKPVFVLAVKGEDSISYSFINLETLIDTYIVSNTPSLSLDIINNEISGNVNISAEEGNTIEIKDDGLYVHKGTYIVNCEVISETDLPAEVVSYDGDFAKIQQTIADGGKVELRAIFNQTLYNLELSRIEDDCVSFNTVDRYSNITIEINETGISDVKYISLRFEPGGEVEDSMFIVSGNINPDDETVTFNQTFEEIKSAQFNGKVLQAEMLVESEGEVVGKYGFNLLYSTSEAIGFDWFSSAGKLGIQITLLEDDTTAFVMTSLEGGGSGESYDDTEIRGLIEGKQDIIQDGESGQILVKHSSTPGSFKWADHTNFVIQGEVSFPENGSITVSGITASMSYSLAKYALDRGKKIVMELTDRDTGFIYHLYLVQVTNYSLEFETHLRDNDLIESVYFTMTKSERYTAKRIVREYMQKVNGTYGQIIGFDENGNCIAKEEGEATKPYVVKMYYTLTDNQFQAIPASRTAKWSDWYPFYEAGGEVILELHKDSVDSGDDIIRLYAHSKGIYDKTYNTLEVQFTSIGETTRYGTSDHTKYLYICWWQSGNSCKVNRYKINEIPTGGATGQALVKKSDTNYDVEWADPTTGGLVITGNYSTDEDDNWVVSNIDKTFAEINEAITNNQDVVLKIYPEGDTSNPYILYPAMHYANMGTAFSLSVCDEGQISGLSVMITADNQVMATRNEYDFEALKKSVSDGKTLVAGAITGKGIETAADAEFATMAENIGKIEAPVIDFKFAEGTEGIYSNTIAIGSNTIVAWMNKSIYYSEDGGKTWNLSDLQTEYGNTPTVIYAKEYDVFVVLVPYANHGIYVSTDGGKTWTLKMGYSNVNTLRYSDGIFVGCSSTTTSGGITYSMDGVHWSLNSNFSSKAITNLNCVNGRWFFCVGGITYTSTDGYNWTTIGGATSGSPLSSIVHYQGVWLANSSGTIFYSNDGVTWSLSTFNWNHTQYGTSIQSISRVGNNYVASTYNGMYYSTDRGKTWNPSNITAGHHSFKLFKGIILAIGAGGPSSGKGIYTSEDGKTWTQSTLPNITNVNSNMFFKGGKALVTAGDGALYSSEDGSTWEYVSGSRKIIAEFNGILLTSDFNYSVDGVNWTSVITEGITSVSGYWFGCNSVLAHSNDASGRGLYYSKAYFS